MTENKYYLDEIGDSIKRSEQKEKHTNTQSKWLRDAKSDFHTNSGEKKTKDRREENEYGQKWKLTIQEHLLDLRSCQFHHCHQFWILFRLGNHIHVQHLPSKCSIYGNLLDVRDVRMNRHLTLHLVMGKRIRWQLLQIQIQIKTIQIIFCSLKKVDEWLWPTF